MCGIAGIVSLTGRPIESLAAKLQVMVKLIAHRGPDGEGVWCSPDRQAGLAHTRLKIIDLSDSGSQPMSAKSGTTITYNGETYNYVELREMLSASWTFRSTSDTETILASYDYFGDECLSHLRGMFSFAIWEESRRRLFCARDRFGIKPFYYAIVNETLYFASEAKALLPFLPEIATDAEALAEYLTFQFTLDELTLFKDIKQLPPGHRLTVENGKVKIRRYWDVRYEIDWEHSSLYFYNRLKELLEDSIAVHLRSDVPVGGYISGGIDSTLVSILAARVSDLNRQFFHGKFTDYKGYDESRYAMIGAQSASSQLYQKNITADDFRDNIQKVIYHLDFPVGGPGSFPQYMVSELAAQHVKVVLGGQGGDEIFGGYARYLLAYFEQCIKASLDGTYKNGNFVVTIESIVPNLGLLKEYKPMIREFWREGLFDALDARYFRLINRASDITDEIDWKCLDLDRVYEAFKGIFNNSANVTKEAYFDKMTHFDFKCLLPALLHVEDRMSMAHGLECRVPLLDQPIVEFAATVPADIKFLGGHMKHLIKEAFADALPQEIIHRRDKMGFPVPLKEWFSIDLADFINDLFGSQAARTRPFMHSDKVLKNFSSHSRFSRKIWGLLGLELWHQTFHDRASEWKGMKP